MVLSHLCDLWEDAGTLISRSRRKGRAFSKISVGLPTLISMPIGLMLSFLALLAKGWTAFMYSKDLGRLRGLLGR